MSQSKVSLSILNPSNRRLEKLWNSYLRFPLPWRFRPAPHRNWENQELGERHGPDQFLNLTDTSNVLVDEVVSRATSPNAAILDLGCNVGRHLHALWLRGFRNLYGVDVQHAALKSMCSTFPEMMPSVTINQGTFQNYLPKISDDSFEVSFTHGATLELVPPTFPICQELSRVSRQFVVLMISESQHLYPRLWEYEFLRAGFVMIKLLRPAIPDSALSLMVFQRQELT